MDNISCIKQIVYIKHGERQLSLISSNESGYDHGGYGHVLHDYGHGHVLHDYGHGHVLHDHDDCDHVLHDYDHDHALHVNLFFTRDHVNNFYVHAFNSNLDLQIFLLLILLERLLLDVCVFVSFILI